MHLIDSVPHHRLDYSALADVELVTMAQNHDERAVRAIIKRQNQRLFRVARAILHSDHEAEDAVQAGYVKAFTHLKSFRGEAQLSTWLTRIVANEALNRVRRKRPTAPVEEIDSHASRQAMPRTLSPEEETARREVGRVLEGIVDQVPDPFRTVFILRDIEGMSIDETASLLSISPETVKSRLFRARRDIRIHIQTQLAGSFAALYPFDGMRCVAMADRVLATLKASNGPRDRR